MITFDTYFDGNALQGPMWIKKCRLCGWQPVSQFSKDKSKHDGLRNTCKSCDNINRKDRYKTYGY